MKKRLTRFFMAVFVSGLALLSTGCSGDSNDGSDGGDAGDDGDSLPANPTIDNPSGAAKQKWYFGFKSYDNTFRIRWPTYFATALGVGPGSYTLVAGQRAEFRSFDTDHGAKRPSYTIRGPKSRFSGMVTCILHSANAEAVGWFQANADVTSQGPLP